MVAFFTSMRTKLIARIITLLVVAPALLLACQQAQAQGKYEQLNITKMRTTAPRPSTCYDTAVGHYPCLEVGVVILHKTASGAEASISTSHKIDGSYVPTVGREFGKYSRTYFESLKSSGFLGSLTVGGGMQLTPEVRQLLEQFVAQINQYEASVDLAARPDGIYDQQALRTLYDITEAFIKAGTTPDEQKQFVGNNLNVSRALIELVKTGINVSTALLPFVNDARDLYELASGRDLITGEPIDTFGRVLSALGLVAGSGSAYRKAILKIQEGLPRKALAEAGAGIPGLKYIGNGGWASNAGLVYARTGEKGENRLRHILKHATPDPTKPNHTVFSAANKKAIPALLDQAWAKRSLPLPNDPGAYLVDMGAVVGTKGEKKIKIVVVPGTSELITAYPLN